MTTQTVITIDHVRAVGLCVHGTRTWFARHDLDFRAFLRDGCDAEILLSTGDAMALKVVDYARARIRQEQH
ncbi:hypothetical protein PZU33_03795 [Pseudomonas aeruginosa]|uniref:hypothetical protein n=1 Tax=Pseudomonas aeruginosa TaxID=287 RepID=UPI0018C7A991|nr:hypothetical protein [Pseudomonas aeruginosa]MBG4644457.1 hypothetical protein [Pseudomonas aeruginosa]MBG5729568.1 hypothetical protein [Pseudomonas aeruginosa]MDU0533944.1 hypothetical protein [Pseudomonas aeruginosa]MEA8678305.1 hypothetical protein [Pseudomonas aeruginosa]MEA8688570.1 hypothetical protein [Pseudomonas aeruginosa]